MVRGRPKHVGAGGTRRVLDGASVILAGVSQGAGATPLARHVGPPKSLVRLPNSEHLVLAGSAGLG